jgi:hypothetical protein
MCVKLHGAAFWCTNPRGMHSSGSADARVSDCVRSHAVTIGVKAHRDRRGSQRRTWPHTSWCTCRAHTHIHTPTHDQLTVRSSGRRHGRRTKGGASPPMQAIRMTSHHQGQGEGSECAYGPALVQLAKDTMAEALGDGDGVPRRRGGCGGGGGGGVGRRQVRHLDGAGPLQRVPPRVALRLARRSLPRFLLHRLHCSHMQHTPTHASNPSAYQSRGERLI